MQSNQSVLVRPSTTACRERCATGRIVDFRPSIINIAAIDRDLSSTGEVTESIKQLLTLNVAFVIHEIDPIAFVHLGSPRS